MTPRFLPPSVRRAFQLAVRRAGRTEADVDDELRFHLDERAARLVARGWSRADAEDEARRRFGPSWDDAVRQLHRQGHQRENRIAMRERLGSILMDVRHAARALRLAPRFTAGTVLTLALGLGATTIIYSLVDHIVLRPLPYRDPAQLVVVREVLADMRDVYPSMPANAAHFLALREACDACDGMAAVKRAGATLVVDGDPRRINAPRVSANMFALLGVRPALGRDFRPEEETVGNERVVLLTDAFWRRQFGADPSVVGRDVRLGSTSFQVIGVLPPGAGLPEADGLGSHVNLGRDIALYRPLALSQQEATTGGQFDYGVVARLKPGISAAQLEARLDAFAADVATRQGHAPGSVSIDVRALQEHVVGGAGRPLWLLLAAVGTVLLIVCTNLTNLALARDAGRQREAAVRVALGASRARLTRLALVESITLAVAGALLGFALAWAGLRVVVALAPASLPRVAEVGLDGRVFAVVSLLALVVGVGIGLYPALRMSHATPAAAMRASSRTATGGRAAARRRAAFIAAQVALSTVLLVGTGLFVASLARVLGVERGFDSDRVLAVDVMLPAATYDTSTKVEQFYRRVLPEVAALPGVAGVAVTNGIPLEGETWVDGIMREGEPTREAQESANLRFVTPGYWEAVGTPLRRGRGITWDDRNRRVAVISERTARTLWPNADPIGLRLVAGPAHTLTEVVGVAADVRTSTLEEEGAMVVYLPAWEYWPWQGTLVVRSAGDPAAVAASVRAAVRRVDATVPVPKVRTMGDVVSQSVAVRRFQVALLVLLAAMAFVTASIGIYGVIAQSLAGRTGEIAVRMALGARREDVHRLVLREGMTPVAIGLALGIATAVALGRWIASLLFEVRPGDPLTIAVVATLLATVAAVACTLPARRATASGLARMLRFE